MDDLTWDIRVEGRAWKGDEAYRRYEMAPGRLEMVHGRPCWSDEELSVLLALLLENVGAMQAVRLGAPNVWREAVASLAPDAGPASA